MAVDLIHLLLVEDNPGDARLLREMLSEIRYARFEVILAERLSDVEQRLRTHHVDILLLDLSLPDSQGLNTFGSC